MLASKEYCPNNGIGCVLRQEGASCTTLAYYPPVYENGININPDKNITYSEMRCNTCGKTFSVSTQNGVSTFSAKDNVDG
jgi:hypothetical protein